MVPVETVNSYKDTVSGELLITHSSTSMNLVSLISDIHALPKNELQSHVSFD